MRIASDKFPDAVRSTKMNLWRPGDPIRTGKRLLIGIALWFGPDTRLLDAVDAYLSETEHNDVAVDVFDVSTVSNRADFDLYIPGITKCLRDTPLVGFWEDGVLQTVKDTAFARSFVVEMFGLEIK
jgi:hypothetical protein